DADFRQAYMQETQRQEQGEDMSLFVKNVENVQGDERDVILFSTTFGRNKQGSFRRNFGVLGQTGGERRLNVAITRARKQVVIFS
ncbi:AAA domain-containing protein, partial [Xenorhabdus bovienii]